MYVEVEKAGLLGSNAGLKACSRCRLVTDIGPGSGVEWLSAVNAKCSCRAATIHSLTHSLTFTHTPLCTLSTVQPYPPCPVASMELVTAPVRTTDVEASLHIDVTSELEKMESVEDFVKAKDVFMISKSTCPFCFELKRTLQSYGVSYDVAEIDKLPSMVSIQKDLKEKYGQSTVPLLFVKGELIGGCTRVKELEHSGEFQRLFLPYLSADSPPEERISRFTILFFPETVNKLVVRAVGLLSMIYCILCVAFYDRRGTKYAVLGLAIDFVLRVVFGSGSSPIGMVGAALMSPFNPIYSAGAPKQFAACCGTFMSVLSAGLLLGGQELAGTIVIGALIFPTGLEGIFDFCLGCWMFGIAISLNIVPPSVYRPYLNYFPTKKWAHEFSTDTSVKYEAVPSTHVLVPGQVCIILLPSFTPNMKYSYDIRVAIMSDRGILR